MATTTAPGGGSTGRSDRGPGGWWIFVEVGVALGPRDIVRPDLAGWHRGRVPDSGDQRPITVLFLPDGLEPRAEHREADEFMELHTLRWSQVTEMIERGEIVDGKTLVSLLFVQTFRR